MKISPQAQHIEAVLMLLLVNLFLGLNFPLIKALLIQLRPRRAKVASA